MLTTDLIPSFIEVKAMERARQQGILDALNVRFGTVPEETRTFVQSITEENRLRSALRLAITAPNFQHFLENA